MKIPIQNDTYEIHSSSCQSVEPGNKMLHCYHKGEKEKGKSVELKFGCMLQTKLFVFCRLQPHMLS